MVPGMGADIWISLEMRIGVEKLLEISSIVICNDVMLIIDLLIIKHVMDFSALNFSELICL